MTTNPTTGVGRTTTGAGAPPATKLPDNNLGQDAFLHLLITELQHQDPTKPLDDRELITQLATFTQVEKLTAIADSMKVIEEAITGFLSAPGSGATDPSNGG